MKIRLLFVTTIMFCLCGIVSAQNGDKFRQQFDNWKDGISETVIDSNDHLYFMANARRNDSESATVKVGLFGIFQSYEITVTPLKYEKNKDSELVQTRSFKETKISTKKSANKVSDKPEFSNPVITFLADSEANAVQVQLKTFDGRNPTITLRLSQEQDNVGSLTNVK